MKLVHESIIQRGKIFQTIRTIFFQSLEKEDLGAWIQLLEKTAELCHRLAPGRNAQYVVNQSLNKLLPDVFTREKPLGDLARCEILVEGNGLCCKRSGRLRT